MREIIITEAEAGQRVDRFLGKYMPGASSGFLHKMLRKKNIKLNGGRADGGEKIKKGDKIEIFFSEETLEKFCRKEKDTQRKKLTAQQQKLRSQVKILFASEHIVVLHKPAGMLTQKAAKEDDSLNDYLLDYCREKGQAKGECQGTFRPSVANRLDRNTSGIVLCGVTMAGLQALSGLLRERNVEKYYLCLVQGRIDKDKKIKGYLVKDEKNNKVRLLQKPIEGASPIETWYEVLDTVPEAALLKVRLITGKSHQIRAHLASEGHPLFGDYKYGNRTFNNRLKRENGINVQMLHSYEIHVPDDIHVPLEELKGLHITAPLPEQFEQVMKQWKLKKTE